MKKTLLACLITSASFSASADFLLGGDIEANVWQQNHMFTGNGFEQEDENRAYTFEVSIEHFIPLIPNPKFAQSSVEGDYYEYTKRDFTLYYEFLDNDLISVDAGVGITQIKDGLVNLTSGPKETSGSIPHVYAAVEAGIPFTPLFVYAKGNAFAYDGNKMLDASVGIQYEIPLTLFDLELQVGYRVQEFDLTSFDIFSFEAQTIDLQSKTDGVFAGVNIDF